MIKRSAALLLLLSSTACVSREVVTTVGSCPLVPEALTTEVEKPAIPDDESSVAVARFIAEQDAAIDAANEKLGAIAEWSRVTYTNN